MILFFLLFLYFIPSIYAMEDNDTPLYTVTHTISYKEIHNSLISAYAKTKKSLFLFHNNKAISVFNTNTGEKTKTITKHIPQASDWICSQHCRCVWDWEPRIWDLFYPTCATYDDTNNLLCVAKQRGHEYGLFAYTIKGSHAKNCYIKPNLTKFTGHTNYVNDMALIPDSLSTIAMDKTIKIWDMPTATCATTITIPKKGQKLIPFSNNSLIALIGKYNSYNLSQWDIRNKQCIQQFAADKPNVSIKVLSPFSEYTFLSTEYMYTCEYNPETFNIIHQHSDSYIHAWDTRTGSVISSCHVDSNNNGNFNNSIEALTHYKQYAIALTTNGFLHIWDTTSDSDKPYQTMPLPLENWNGLTLTKLDDDSLLILGKENLIKLALTR